MLHTQADYELSQTHKIDNKSIIFVFSAYIDNPCEFLSVNMDYSDKVKDNIDGLPDNTPNQKIVHELISQ